MLDHSELCDALCHVLGNTCRIARTTKSYEWNVAGFGALTAEKCFRDQCEEMDNSMDPLAAHIRNLGGQPILDYSDAVVAVNPPTADAVPNLTAMIKTLAEGHTQATHSIGATLDLAQEVEELTTIQRLTHRLDAHRGHHRRLILLAQTVCPPVVQEFDGPQ